MYFYYICKLLKTFIDLHTESKFTLIIVHCRVKVIHFQLIDKLLQLLLENLIKPHEQWHQQSPKSKAPKYQT